MLVSRQGKVRLTKWFVTIPPKEKAKIVKDGKFYHWNPNTIYEVWMRARWIGSGKNFTGSFEKKLVNLVKFFPVVAIFKGFYIGMKLVRGAYMEKENKRAEEKGYVSPICVSKEATDINYDNAVQYMLEHIEKMAIFAGNSSTCPLSPQTKGFPERGNFGL